MAPTILFFSILRTHTTNNSLLSTYHIFLTVACDVVLATVPGGSLILDIEAVARLKDFLIVTQSPSLVFPNTRVPD